jgi:hypothetical protein
MIAEIEVTQMLVFIEGETNNPTGLIATDTLVMAEVAKNFSQLVAASNFFNVGHRVALDRSIYHVSTGDRVEFYQSGNKQVDQQDVVQSISFGSQALLVEYEVVSHSLNLSQVAAVDFCTAARDALVMTGVAVAQLFRGRGVAQTLIVTSSANCVIDDDETYSITLPTLTGPNAPECR